MCVWHISEGVKWLKSEHSLQPSWPHEYYITGLEGMQKTRLNINHCLPLLYLQSCFSQVIFSGFIYLFFDTSWSLHLFTLRWHWVKWNQSRLSVLQYVFWNILPSVGLHVHINILYSMWCSSFWVVLTSTQKHVLRLSFFFTICNASKQ